MQALDACDTTINNAVSALQEADKQLKKVWTARRWMI